MLKLVDERKFATAIKQSYVLMTDISAANMANHLIKTLDPIFEDAVIAWIEGREIPDVAVGGYSVTKVLGIRNNSDYLAAFKLLSEYKQDPKRGEKNIWQCRR